MAEEKNNQPSERVVVEIYGNSYPLKTDNPQEMKKLADIQKKGERQQ